MDDLEQHLHLGHNLPQADAHETASKNSKDIKKGLLSLSDSNIAMFENVQKRRGTRAAFEDLGCQIIRNQSTSSSNAPAPQTPAASGDALRQQLLVALCLAEDVATGTESLTRGKTVAKYIEQKYGVRQNVPPPWLKSIMQLVRKQCTADGTANLYCSCLENWGLFLAANPEYGGEKAILSAIAIEAYLKVVMECTKTAVAENLKAIKKALEVSGTNEKDVLRAKLLHLELSNFRQKWILPLLRDAAEERHQQIAQSYDAQEVMDAVTDTYLSETTGEEIRNKLKKIIGPDGTVLQPDKWNQVMKKVVGRFVIGQSMRAGNLAGVKAKDCGEFTVEDVDGEVEITVPLKHHKVSKFKKAYLSVSLQDFQSIITPLTLAATKRAEQHPGEPDADNVFVTVDMKPIRKSEFFLSEVNKGRKNLITTNIIRHCSTKLVMTGKNKKMTIQEHARVLLHDVNTATKIYFDLSRKDVAANALNYKRSLQRR